MVALLVHFDILYLFLVNIFHLLLVSNVVANFHLLFNEVLSLDERAYELFSLFTLQVSYFVLVNYICNLELLFLSLQLMLLVHELLPQDTFLIIEVEEDAQVFGHLIVLLGLDNSLDLALLGHLLLHLVYFLNVFL